MLLNELFIKLFLKRSDASSFLCQLCFVFCFRRYSQTAIILLCLRHCKLILARQLIILYTLMVALLIDCCSFLYMMGLELVN